MLEFLVDGVTNVDFIIYMSLIHLKKSSTKIPVVYLVVLQHTKSDLPRSGVPVEVSMCVGSIVQPDRLVTNSLVVSHHPLTVGCLAVHHVFTRTVIVECKEDEC